MNLEVLLPRQPGKFRLETNLNPLLGIQHAIIALMLLFQTLTVICAQTTQLPAGKIVWWGEDEFWTERPMHNTNGLIEVNNEFVTNAVAVAGCVALKSDGTVVGFGRDFRRGFDKVPAGLSNVVSITKEGNSFWAIRNDGTVARWGRDELDDLNIVAGLSNITSIAWGGFQKYLALKKDGTLVAFRLDKLPHADISEPIRPVRVGSQILSNIVAVTSMDHTPLVLTKDGRVFSLSYQTPGAPVVNPRYEASGNSIWVFLGAESAYTPYRYTATDPVIVNGQTLTNVVALAGSENLHLALKADGTVVGWGDNTYGGVTVPSGLSNVVAIVANGQSMALKRDGTIVAWGAMGKLISSSNSVLIFNPVPAGLSNVVAIGSGKGYNMAIITGSVPSSIFIQPHGCLEQMEQDADLVFKGRVITSTEVTSVGFPDWGAPHDTRLEVITVFKGNLTTNAVDFLHMTHGPNNWSGSSPPPDFILRTNESYIIFADHAGTADWLYEPQANRMDHPNFFRQLMHGVPPVRTLDARERSDLSEKEAHWDELNLLLNDSNPTNMLYAIRELDQLSMAGRSDDRWFHTIDFKRKAVLDALLPLVTNANEQVAIRAIDCFATETNPTVALQPYAKSLVNVANQGHSSGLRLKAIAALSGTQFEAISNALVELLQSPDDKVRADAVGLLRLYPNNFSTTTLMEHAADNSPEVRARVASVIGDRQIRTLIPTLVKLFFDPVGMKNPLPPLTLDDLESGQRPPGNGDVHTTAGYALLKFDLDDVGAILRTNLNDAGFRLQFLCKLAEHDPAPWIDDMVKIMEKRRERNLAKAKANGFPPETFMYLSGTHNSCWKIIYSYLCGQPASEFANGKWDRCLDMLENAGTTGSQEPTSLYELYRKKGLDQRAVAYRSHCEKTFQYDIGYYFKMVDAQLTNSNSGD